MKLSVKKLVNFFAVLGSGWPNGAEILQLFMPKNMPIQSR